MEKKSIESHMHAKVTRGEVNSYDTCKVEDRQNAMKYVRRIWDLRKSIHVRQIEKHTIGCCANAKKYKEF